MTTSYTLTGDLASLLGGDIKAPKHVKVTLSTNLGDVALVDLDANEVRLSGTTRVDLTDDLTFSLSLIATNSTGTNVTDGTLRYKVDAIYRDANNRERTWTSGYFTLTADADLSDKAGAAGDLDVTVAPSPSLIDSPQAANINSSTSATRTALNSLYVSVANRPISLRDTTGIDWTGATDSRGAIQDAITAAGVGATIEMGRPGIIRCDSGISLLEHQTLIGGGPFTGAGASPQSEIKFPTLVASQVGVTGGGNNVIRSLLIRGPMTGANSTVGFKSTAGSPRFENTGFYGWAIGTSLANAYYAVFDRCEWVRNKYGLVNSGNYNLTLVAPRFWCGYGASDASLGYAIDGGARGMTILGGSVERYQTGIRVYSKQQLDAFGLYMESSTAGAGIYAVDASSTDGVAINLVGGTKYLTEHTRYLNLSGATNLTLNARGQKFVCPTSSTTSPIAYYLNTTDTTVKGDVGADDWSEVLKVGALYVPTAVASLGVKALRILHPTRTYADGRLSTTATLDFPSIAAAGQQELTVTLTGAVVGDQVQVGPPATLEGGLVPSARVSAPDTVTVRLSNITGAAIDPASAAWRVTI